MSDSEFKLTDIAPYLLELTKGGPGNGWQYRAKVLESLYEHERSKLDIAEGARCMVLGSYANTVFNQPGIDPGRAVRVREVYWHPDGSKWVALVAPDRVWWWNTTERAWVESSEVRLYQIAVDHLIGLGEDWVDLGAPTDTGPERGVVR